MGETPRNLPALTGFPSARKEEVKEEMKEDVKGRKV